MWGRLMLFGLLLGLPAVAHADPCEAALPRPGQAFSGQVRYVGDGDSLCVGNSTDPRSWIEVRLADFYAPELKSSAGPQAKAALQRITLGRTLQCQAGQRSYDRVVAHCTLGGALVGDLMRRAGVPEGGRGHGPSR